MTIKRKITIISIILCSAAVLIVGASVLIYKSVIAPFLGVRETPRELREARIISGADVLTKSEFYMAGKSRTWRGTFSADNLRSRFDSIKDVTIGQLDGKPGLDIGLVGRLGVTLLDLQGNVQERINYQFEKGSVKLGPVELERERNSFYAMRLIDLEGDGVCEILGYGGIDGAAIFNHQGRMLLNRGPYEDDKTSIKEVASGDLDGDGELDFVASWGYKPWKGLELFDRYGNSKWRREEESLPRNFEIVDANGDVKPEIVEADGESLIIRDAQGNTISESHMPVILWHLSLCERPDGEKPPQNLAVRKGSLWLIDLDGKNYSQFDCPLSEIKLEKPRVERFPGLSDPLVFDNEEVYRARGVWVRLKKGEPKCLAVVANFGSFDRSLFYVYDEKGELIYQEILPEECNAIVALPAKDDSSNEEILVGGEKTIWRYASPLK